MRDPQSSACGTLWACIFAIALAFWVALQAHVNYTFDSGMWIGLDSAWFSGGQTHVNEITLPDRQNNMRLGATLSLPMSREQTLSSSSTAQA
jgi:hypothetical protein